MFERRPFKSSQTNGTVPRSAVTKPTLSLGVSGCSLVPSPSCVSRCLKPKHEKEEDLAARSWENAVVSSFPHVARWLIYEEDSLGNAGINKRLRGQKRTRKHNSVLSDTEKDSSLHATAVSHPVNRHEKDNSLFFFKRWNQTTDSDVPHSSRSDGLTVWL